MSRKILNYRGFGVRGDLGGCRFLARALSIRSSLVSGLPGTPTLVVTGGIGRSGNLGCTGGFTCSGGRTGLGNPGLVINDSPGLLGTLGLSGLIGLGGLGCTGLCTDPAAALSAMVILSLVVFLATSIHLIFFIVYVSCRVGCPAVLPHLNNLRHRRVSY